VLSDACIERVRSGAADFALASSRAATPGLRIDEFCTDSFHLVCRHDHALAKTRGRLSVDHLVPHPIVQLARSSSVRQYLDAAIYPLKLQTIIELDQLSTVAGMVRAGLGVTVVPSLTLFHFEHPQLVTRSFAVPGLVRQLFVVRRADRSLSSAAQGLFELLMAARPKRARAAQQV